MGTVAGVRHHRVRRDDDAALSGELSSGSRGRLSLNRRRANLFLLIGREDRNLLVRDIRPLNKLLTPLHDGHPEKHKVSLDSTNGPNGFSAYDDVQRTRHDFLIVHAAVIPTSVFPAPQGRTIIPDRARLHTHKLRDAITTP